MCRAREQRSDVLLADEALRLATLDAARALDLESEVGSLTPGKRADLTVLSLTGSPYDPIEDPTLAVVFGGSPAGILETIVDGQTRYRQGETAWHEVLSTASAARRRMLA
jgi:5-methylthioadenosine/S-adenosylhomocysteine deaminase